VLVQLEQLAHQAVMLVLEEQEEIIAQYLEQHMVCRVGLPVAEEEIFNLTAQAAQADKVVVVMVQQQTELRKVELQILVEVQAGLSIAHLAQQVTAENG
jgi:hypothetical protein